MDDELNKNLDKGTCIRTNLIDLPNELLCLVIDQAPELIPCCKVTYSIGVATLLSSINGPGSLTNDFYDSSSHSTKEYLEFIEFLKTLIKTDKAQYVKLVYLCMNY